MSKQTWLKNASFTELTPRERLDALLGGSLRELLGPFARVSSPWLALQGLMAQTDDGVIVGTGVFAERPMVVAAIEPAFEGGSIGEVGGTKIATMLELAAESCRDGVPIAALLLIESGGVRLGEANLGLSAIARIQRAIVALRQLAPVVALVAGPTGCFGGMSLAVELCSQIVGTKHGRLGMNGPEVIEQEAGADEIDSTDRRQIWKLIGCEARLRDGFIDFLAEDTAESVATELQKAFECPLRSPQRIADAYQRLLQLREAQRGQDESNSARSYAKSNEQIDTEGQRL